MLMTPFWEAWGINVIHVYGTERFVPADAVLVHVDLSVVPEDYLEFAHRYPLVINGKITDIRKRSYSPNLLRSGDDYPGPVIIKTSLNSSGAPEAFSRYTLQGQSFWQRLRRRLFSDSDPDQPFGIRDKKHYRIYPSLNKVPAKFLQSPDLVVEPFVPERHGEYYCLRECYFFGDVKVARCEVSLEPVFMSGEDAPELAEPPPQMIYDLREHMHLDYGKIDYVMREGKPVLFDVNKTTGVTSLQSVRGKEDAGILAKGIFTYFPELKTKAEPVSVTHY